eukprot:CAMPEP_0175641626 /NCGR_PEP_ID=MMETSP0097-20121207/4855_1 /TAXON_ID=311494 /ORGANISM="Alexandrium monilatum, Strain CCMP3105" /LENGTH=291 /DNA_ID=CAMNT_0016947403 /DNA_START=22 /DNA_END=897 /DNA_ORIENTATION=+
MATLGAPQPSSILCFTADGPDDGRGEQQPMPRDWTGCRPGMATFTCTASPWTPSKPLSRPLWLYLWFIIAEASGVVIFTLNNPGASQVPLVLFLLALFLQGVSTACVQSEVVTASSVQQVRHALTRIHMKLCLMVGGAALPAAFWHFEFFAELRRLSEAGAASGADGFPWGQERVRFQYCAAALGMVTYHSTLACVVSFLAHQISNHPMQHLLEPTTLEACEFAEVPVTARTEDARCSICFEDIESSDVVLPLPCRHVFHAQCLGQWLRRSEACPLRCPDTLLYLPDAAQD